MRVINKDGFTYLENCNSQFDVIIADFPDPRTINLGRLYSKEFYWLCLRSLNLDGVFITQAGSPYYAEKAFKCIEYTMQAAGFNTLPLHNQVLTLGEWGWIIGVKDHKRSLKSELQSQEINVPTEWLTDEALTLISSFGEEVFSSDRRKIDINRLNDPVLFKYYLDGRWDIY